MSKVALGARLLSGLIFVVLGLDGLLHFLPMPEPEPAAGAFVGAMMATGYLWPLLKIVEITAGAFLLTGKFVPLAIVMLAPVAIPILGFNTLVAPSGLVMGLVVIVLWLLLLVAYWPHFACLLNANAKVAETGLSP